LRILPREIRDIIYEYALSVESCPHTEVCSCIKEERRARNPVALLRTCGSIYNEAVPFLYRSELFGISVGYEKPIYRDEPVEWIDPIFYRQTLFDRQIITRLPRNAFRLIQNLELKLTNDTMRWSDEEQFPFVACTDIFLQAITQICSFLSDSDQLQYLDINLTFACKFADIDYMTQLLEPIKMLRSIRDPNITVYGHQHGQKGITWLDWNHDHPHEPRWCLTEEYTEYLQDLLRSPHGTPTLPSDGLQVFGDCNDSPELLENADMNIWKDEVDGLIFDWDSMPAERREAEEQSMRNYLRDMYGIEDLKALQGGMPKQWQIWLNSEVWFLLGLKCF
jgi:hypothetical protein